MADVIVVERMTVPRMRHTVAPDTDPPQTHCGRFTELMVEGDDERAEDCARCEKVRNGDVSAPYGG